MYSEKVSARSTSGVLAHSTQRVTSQPEITLLSPLIAISSGPTQVFIPAAGAGGKAAFLEKHVRSKGERRALRLARAQELLKQRIQIQIDIAALCGFASQSDMTSVFESVSPLRPLNAGEVHQLEQVAVSALPKGMQRGLGRSDVVRSPSKDLVRAARFRRWTRLRPVRLI